MEVCVQANKRMNIKAGQTCGFTHSLQFHPSCADVEEGNGVITPTYGMCETLFITEKYTKSYLVLVLKRQVYYSDI